MGRSVILACVGGPVLARVCEQASIATQRMEKLYFMTSWNWRMVACTMLLECTQIFLEMEG